MRKFWTLMRVQLKSGAIATTDGTTKQWKKLLLYLVLLVCMLPTLVLIAMLFYYGFDYMRLLDQAGYLMNVGFLMTAVIIFLFSIFAIPSVYYFSKDIDHLLVLPIKPEVILTSKLAVCIVYEYLFAAAVLVPMYISFILQIGFSFLSFLCFLIIFFTLPIYPLVLSSVLTMVIMRFVPFFNNRDRFNLIGGIIVVASALGLSFWMQTMETEDMSAVLMALMDGNNSLMQFGTMLFPFVPSAALSCFHGDLLQLLLYLGITAISLVVFLICGKLLYFKGAIGGSETSHSRHTFDQKQLSESRHHSVFRTYLIKEFKILFRTPVFFTNCVLTALLMPIILTVAVYTSLQGMDLRAFITPQLLESIPNLWCYVLVISFLVGSFMGGINMISSTAISREGTNAYFMKFIPVPVETQAFAKAACGIIISAVSGWLLLIPLHLVLSYPIYLDLIFVVGSLVSVIMTNLFGILIDLLRPKLVWEQEAAAVKQNLNGVISILLSFLLAAVCFGLLYIGWDQVLLITIGLLVIQIVLSFLLYMGVKRAGTRLLSQI
ncbi:MAG: putative ABC transporter permease subunit [Merdibacter sp.]